MLHIELVVPNIEKTCQFLNDVFGSEKVEVEFADFLDGEFSKVVHINLSNVVLQYIQPLQKVASWYEQLQKSGPGVHNITFLVSDIKKTVDSFKNNGISHQISFPLEWENLVGKEDFNPNSRTVHIFNTMDKLGFHLELFERPSKTKTDYMFTEVKEWWDKNQ
jgi:catechol 2,3-dioxygenase-like lactoylglutathione lyase family enzyme